jgi:pyruvate dehydrogenase E2 component (dihydrolipoamide acetyltransferase)
MPALSPTMTQGKIQKWNFKVGDEVRAGDVLAEIETDKSSVGMELQDDGYIAYVQQGSEFKIGQLIAIVVSKKENIQAFSNYSSDSDNAAQ